MTRITKDEFIQRYQDKALDLTEAQRGEQGQQLQQVGLNQAQLAQADLNRDGKIHGAREVGALFQRVDSFETAGTPQSVVLRQPTGATTQAGQAVRLLDLMFTGHQEPGGHLTLQRPVGPRQPNQREDVLAVQTRLQELGFQIEVDGSFGNQTKQALQVYEAMLRGTDRVSQMPGNIRPNTDLFRVMSSEDAPRWTRMPASGPGLVNHDTDGYSYGSERLAEVLRDAGQSYHNDYITTRPNASLMSLNDASVRNGGDNHDHSTHENGLDMDIRLPTTLGEAGTRVGASNYDREATYAMVKALASDPRVERILLSDATLRRMARDNREPWADKVQDGGPVHRDHLHVDVSPPPTLINR